MSSGAELTAADPWYPAANELAGQLVARTGDSVHTVLLYGSHVLAANPDRHSAYDFVVVVNEYRPFYRGLRDAGELRRPVWLMSAMAHVLPPNVIAFAPEDARQGIAKCLIVSRPHLKRALGSDAKDHFLMGRLVQKVGLVWSRSDADVAWLEEVLAGARAHVLTWLAPYLEAPTDPAGLGRRLLEVCYQGEFRPEARDRAESIFLTQVDHFEDTFGPVLTHAAASGAWRREGDGYLPAQPPPAREIRRWRRHFRRSKLRSTARWLKHTITFDNWLAYVVRKAERHSGTRIELTRLERRWPLIFLWPRAIRFLRNRPPGGEAS